MLFSHLFGWQKARRHWATVTRVVVGFSSGWLLWSRSHASIFAWAHLVLGSCLNHLDLVFTSNARVLPEKSGNLLLMRRLCRSFDTFHPLSLLLVVTRRLGAHFVTVSVFGTTWLERGLLALLDWLQVALRNGVLQLLLVARLLPWVHLRCRSDLVYSGLDNHRARLLVRHLLGSSKIFWHRIFLQHIWI